MTGELLYRVAGLCLDGSYRGCPGRQPPTILTMTSTTSKIRRPGPQPLWAAARQACARSRELIRESQVVLDLHREAVAALRSTLPGSTLAAEVASDGESPPRSSELSREVEVGSLRLLPLRRTLIGDGTNVLLTPSEWQLFVALLTRRPRTLSRSDLASSAWGPGFAGRHGEVEVYVSRLRRKLARAGGAVTIETVRGQGYRLTLGDEPVPSAQLGGGAA